MLTIDDQSGNAQAYINSNGSASFSELYNLSTYGSHTGLGIDGSPVWVYGNLGIGTITPQGALTVMNGNVGIGTWVPGGALIVKGGNVGLGSNNPGQVLDVTGTVRATAFIGNGSQLTGIGGMQWTTTNTNDVYLPSNGNVGLGTTITGGAALTVMNGNVGIGTWVPGSALSVTGNVVASGTIASTGLSTNGIPYVTAGGVLTTNVTYLMYTPGSGFLAVNNAGGASSVNIYGNVGNPIRRVVYWENNSNEPRFSVGTINNEPGSGNAGSDYVIQAYNDAGTLLSTPLQIQRSTGNIGLGTAIPGSKLSYCR